MVTKSIALKIINTELISLFDTASLTIIPELKAVSTIVSLAPVGFPDISIEDSDTQRLEKELDIEWNSPRFQLNLLLGLNGEWSNIGAINLINQKSIPYRNYDLVSAFTNQPQIELGTGATLGVQLVNAGYGLPSNADKIMIYGCYQQKSLQENSYSFTETVSTNSQIILEENADRKYAIFNNEGANIIYLNLSDTAIAGQGIPIHPGGNYELTIDYLGIVAAITEAGNTTVIGLELS